MDSPSKVYRNDDVLKEDMKILVSSLAQQFEVSESNIHYNIRRVRQKVNGYKKKTKTEMNTCCRTFWKNHSHAVRGKGSLVMKSLRLALPLPFVKSTHLLQNILIMVSMIVSLMGTRSY